jgi:hypothetical protein
MKLDVNQEKVKRMSKFLRITTQVFYWCGIAGVVLLGIGAIAVTFLPDKYFLVNNGMNDNLGFSIDGLINYKVDSMMNNNISIKPIQQAIMTMASICAAGFAIIFKQISNILKTVEQDRPFDGENSKRLTVIGFVLLFGSIVFRIAEGIVASTIINTFDIPHMQVNYSTDTFMMLSGFLILILAGVFKYGNYLQQEYDATL